jgi:ABC-type proline/glycine betaine transport system permease subunit
MNKNIIAIAIASLGFVIGLGILGNAIKNETNLKIPFQ